MKSIYWDYLEAIDLLVVREVEDKCMRMFLNHVIQLWLERGSHSSILFNYLCQPPIQLDFPLDNTREPFLVEYAQFASILGFPSDDLSRQKIHERENMLDD